MPEEDIFEEFEVKHFAERFVYVKSSILIGSLNGPNFEIRTAIKMDRSRINSFRRNIEQNNYVFYKVETFLLHVWQTIWLHFYESGQENASIHG